MSDCVIVGASFAGLACAEALARGGLDVTILEKKSDVGDKLHTTGILVKDAIDQVPLLDGLPPELARRVDGVRLYAPSLRHVDLSAPGYYFLATDTPRLMHWLAARAVQAGARMRCGVPVRTIERTPNGICVGDFGPTRYLVGADGPQSRVARALGLGVNTRFLFGIEHEYAGVSIPDPDRLHCFIDRRLAPGYIGWVVAGVGVVQVGLARRMRRESTSATAAMRSFLDKIAPIFDFRARRPESIRAGMIPCGGVVHPVASRRMLLIGDAAGMVSPVTAGGIHMALRHGAAAGHAIADFLGGRSVDPCEDFVRSYPRFRTKRLLRWLFDHLQTDVAFNLLLGTRAMRAAASVVYFHRKGVFNAPAARHDASGALRPPRPAGEQVQR